MRRYILVLFVSLICCYGYCQVRDFGLNLSEYNFLSAESFSMIKYGDLYERLLIDTKNRHLENRKKKATQVKKPKKVVENINMNNYGNL